MGKESRPDQPTSFRNTNSAGTASRGFVYSFVGTVVAMLAIIILLSIFDKTPLQHLGRSTFCCPEVLKDIFAGANKSVDPCKRIAFHTCYVNILTRDGRTGRPVVNTDPVDGSPTTEAGRAVAAYHRACLSRDEVQNMPHGRAAADVLLEATSPPRSSPTAQRLVALIIDLSLKYGLPSLIQFGMGTGSNWTVHLQVSLAPLETLPETPSANMVSELKGDALQVVNHHFSLKLTLQEVDAFLSQVTDSTTTATEKYTLDSFGDIHPELRAAEWKEMLGVFEISDNVNVQGVPLQQLKDRFSHILEPGQRVLALTSALVTASVRLASRLILHGNTSEARNMECRKRANELLPLWVLDRVSDFRSKFQDDAIVEAFRLIARAVLTRVKSGMKSDDFRRLETTLSGMRVALPSQVVPEGLPIPTMTSNYARAELAAHAYVLRTQRHQMMNWGVSEGFSKHFLDRNGSVTEGVFVVPTHVYTALPLVNATDPLLLASTVGPYIADALWNFIFQGDWGPVSNVVLREYGRCIQENTRSMVEWLSELMWLSVATSIDAARSADWDSLVRPSGAWDVTWSQLFYMSFVHHILCPDPLSKLQTYGLEVDIFMSAFEDFYRAFHCNTTVSKLNGYVCSLNIGSPSA